MLNVIGFIVEFGLKHVNQSLYLMKGIRWYDVHSYGLISNN